MSRPRRDPSKGYKVTLDVLIAALDIDAWERRFGGEEGGRRAWSALKGDLHTNPGTLPAPAICYDLGRREEAKVTA